MLSTARPAGLIWEMWVNIPVTKLEVARATLDDVFLKHTGRNIRTEQASGDEVDQMVRPWLGLNKR